MQEPFFLAYKKRPRKPIRRTFICPEMCIRDRVSELALALMSFLAVKRLVPFCWDTINMIVKPVLLLLVSIGVYLAFSQACVWLKELPLFIMTTVQILFLSFSYMGLLLLFHKKRPLP